MTLPNLTDSKEGSLNETGVPVGAAAPRVGVLGWFGTPSINSGTGGAVGDRDEPKPEPRVEEVTSEPECAVSEKETLLLEREQQVESREKELEERKVVIDQREKEMGDRSRELEDRGRVMKGELEERERVLKEGEVELQRKTEEVERREKELEERRREFEEEREKWLEEKNRLAEAEPEWRVAMDALKKELDMELIVERKKAEERELGLETRVMKKITEILATDKDEQKGRKKRWDVIKPLTR